MHWVYKVLIILYLITPLLIYADVWLFENPDTRNIIAQTIKTKDDVYFSFLVRGYIELTLILSGVLLGDKYINKR